MAYKIGDKFVIEIEDTIPARPDGNEQHVLYRVGGIKPFLLNRDVLDYLEQLDGDYVNENFGELQDESYAAGARDMQEAIKKVLLPECDGGISYEDYKNLFGDIVCKDILLNFTPKELLRKIEEYEVEKAKNEKEKDNSNIIKMVQFDNTYVPEELCSIDRLGGVDDTHPCNDSCIMENCDSCIVTKVFNEYARLTGQIGE